MQTKPKSITSKNFAPYGKIIEYPNQQLKGTTRNLWRIVHEAANTNGWRIAYLILRDKTLGQLGAHPTSDETFEPISGKTLLFVSQKKDLTAIECFHLDKPVIVFKGIWHNVITLSKESEIKITENLKMTSDDWKFGFRIKNLQELNKKTNSSFRT